MHTVSVQQEHSCNSTRDFVYLILESFTSIVCLLSLPLSVCLFRSACLCLSAPSIYLHLSVCISLSLHLSLPDCPLFLSASLSVCLSLLSICIFLSVCTALCLCISLCLPLLSICISLSLALSLVGIRLCWDTMMFDMSKLHKHTTFLPDPQHSAN